MKLFLSSLEINYEFGPKVAQKSQFVLMSFYYLQKNQRIKWLIDLMNERNKADDFILDSGAFTFMNGKRATEKQFDSYVNRYIEFIKKYHIKRYVELDVDALFGESKAFYYRNKLEKEIGYQCIPIWHKQRGIQSFKNDCKNYSYIGIGGLAVKDIKPSEYEKLKILTGYANAHKTKVHAMGFTPSHEVHKFGFYSSDSSSWTSAKRFANIPYFDGSGIKTHKKPANTRMVISKRTLISKIAYSEWCKYQKYVVKKGVV